MTPTPPQAGERAEALSGYPHMQCVFPLLPDDEKFSDMAVRPANEHELEAIMLADEWGRSADIHLQPQVSSRAHKACESWSIHGLMDAGNPTIATAYGRLLPPQGTFMIQHDWAGALGAEAMQVGNDFRTPYDRCGFEMRVNGRNLFTYVGISDTLPMAAMPFVEVNGYWIGFDGDTVERYPLLQKTWDQIRAACVALDAEVATHEVVRAPHLLNKKRERAGKLPILDHHVISLARRHRVEPLGGEPTGNRKRLHFRRGHWRHYEQSKTWINWMLVGNPDLGFIDKEYRL